MNRRKYTTLYSNYQEYENQIFGSRIREFYDQGYALHQTVGIRRKILVFQYSGNTKKRCLVMQRNLSERMDARIAQLIEEKQKILYQNRQIVVFETDRDKNHETDEYEKEQNRASGLPLSYKKMLIPLLLLLADIFLMAFRIWFYKPGHLLLDCYGKIFPVILFFTACLYLLGDVWDFRKGISVCDQNRIRFDRRSAFKQRVFLAGDVICGLLLLTYLIMSLGVVVAADAAVILNMIRSWLIFLTGYVFSFRWKTPYCAILMILFICLALI